MFSITSESGRLRSAPRPRAALRSGGADDDDDDESVYSVSVQKTTFSDDRSHFFSAGENTMKEPGLDGRHRDKNRPKAGRIQQKRSDTLNENLDNPIPQFSPKATLGTMREETGRVSEEAVRREARKIRPGKG